MRVLAIHDGHTATACYLRDGELTSIASEERFTNKKNQGGFPKHAVDWILQHNSLAMGDVDYIAIPHLIAPVTYNEKLPEFSLRRLLFVRLNRLLPRSVIGSNVLIRPYRMLFGASRRATINSYVQKFGLPVERIRQVEHHTAHAYAALYGSGFTLDPDAILIFTSDDSGDGVTSSVGVWRKTDGYARLRATQSFNSMGDLYARVTQFLGMKRGEHEYKIMGMAPYVPHEHSERAFGKLLEYMNFDSATGQIVNRKYYGPYLLKCFQKDFFGERFDSICAGIQRQFEHVTIRWVRYWAKRTGIRRAVFGGGSFMNVKANMLISELNEFDSVFFCPSSGDESTAVGAAYKVAVENGERAIKPLTSIFKGPAFSGDCIETVLLRYQDRIEWEGFPDIEKKTAELLATGKIVARFRGPAEWGARALGGRSILCRADDLRVIHRLNRAIKMRDFWMPFAASILEGDAGRYIHNPKNVPGPFMMLTYRTTEVAQSEIIAGLHPFDRTCRAQLVSKETNPSYHKLLTYFKTLTGYSGLLNTSFNLHGFPIVGTPEIALQTLLGSRLDYLALEDFLVKPRPGVQPPLDI